MAKIRPNALVLVESLGIPEEILATEIGKKEGGAYESLLESARFRNPINTSKVFSAVTRYLKPRL